MKNPVGRPKGSLKARYNERQLSHRLNKAQKETFNQAGLIMLSKVIAGDSVGDVLEPAIALRDGYIRRDF